MNIGLASAACAGFLAVIVKGFGPLWRKWRSGPDNNWKNEAYVARDEAGSWTENEMAPGYGSNTAAPSILSGLES